MTTDKPVVDSLTAQGKGVSQEEAPPQTIIGTFTTIEAVRDAAVRARALVGVGLGKDIMRKFGCKIADIPQHRWQEAGEFFDSLTTNGETIMRSCEAQCDTDFNNTLNFGHESVTRGFPSFIQNPYGKSPIIPAKVDGGAEGIIRPGKFSSACLVPDSIREAVLPSNFDGDGPGEEDGPWAKGWEDRVGCPKIIRDAEQRRQTVQAEAMVNLAVGYTLVQLHATIMKTTPDLLDKVKRSMKIYPEALAQFQRDYSVDQQIDDAGVVTIIVTPKEV